MNLINKWKSGLGISDKRAVPDGVWMKCEGKGADAGLGCGQTLYRRDLEENLWVCPHCGFHHRIDVQAYLAILVDEDTYVPMFEEIASVDPLEFKAAKKYSDKIRDDVKKTGQKCAFVAGEGRLSGRRVAIGGMNFGFRRRESRERGRRKDLPPGRLRHVGAVAAGDRLAVGRSPHAGGVALVDADGQDKRETGGTE